MTQGRAFQRPAEVAAVRVGGREKPREQAIRFDALGARDRSVVVGVVTFVAVLVIVANAVADVVVAALDPRIRLES